jgi:hypothetical protein
MAVSVSGWCRSSKKEDSRCEKSTSENIMEHAGSHGSQAWQAGGLPINRGAVERTDIASSRCGASRASCGPRWLHARAQSVPVLERRRRCAYEIQGSSGWGFAHRRPSRSVTAVHNDSMPSGCPSLPNALLPPPHPYRRITVRPPSATPTSTARVRMIDRPRPCLAVSSVATRLEGS